jgi:hypothetical protein
METYNNYTSGFLDYSIPSSPFSTSGTSGGSTTGGTKTGGGAKFDWGGLGSALLTVGGGIYASEQNRKNAQAQADALIRQGMSQIEVQKLILEGKRLDLEASKNAVAGGKSGNTLLYVGLGIGGVLVLGVVIFAVTRKKA